MNGKIFGITWGLIFVVVVTAIIARKWGSAIPLLNKI